MTIYSTFILELKLLPKSRTKFSKFRNLSKFIKRDVLKYYYDFKEKKLKFSNYDLPLFKQNNQKKIVLDLINNQVAFCNSLV